MSNSGNFEEPFDLVLISYVEFRIFPKANTYSVILFFFRKFLNPQDYVLYTTYSYRSINLHTMMLAIR